MANPPLHAVPPCSKHKRTKGTYDVCPSDSGIADAEFERATEGSLAGCIVRLVAGYDPEKRTFARTRYSYQLLSGLELGWAHAACDAGGGGEVLSAIAQKLPDVAAWAWGPDEAKRLADKDYADQVCNSFKNLYVQPQAGDWMLAGWHAIAGRGDVQHVYTQWYWDDVVNDVVKWMQDKGLRKARTLAAATRISNSRRTWFKNLRDDVEALGEDAGVSKALEEYRVNRSAEAVDIINSWPCFQGEIQRWPEPSDISWRASADPPRPQSFPVLPTEPGQTKPPPVTELPGVRGVIAKGMASAQKHPWALAAILAAAGIGIAAVLLGGKKKR